MTLVRHEFGEEGPAYLRAYFASNTRFGRRLGTLLSERDLERGTTWSLVPEDAPPARRKAFGQGGLYPKPGYERPRVTSRPDIQAWLGAWLDDPAATTRYVLCSEDAMRQRTDPAQGTSDTPCFFCGDDVYWYSEKPEDVVRIPWPSAKWHPAVGMVTALPSGLSGLEHRRVITPPDLEAMAVGAVAVVVGAWDAEGWLIWEPARGA